MRPEALAWSAENCTIGRAMEIVGEKWTVLVLREVFIGIRRFEDMRVRTGIPRQVLTNRLASLVDHGLLRREPYQEPGARSRDEYRLTDKGLDLYPVMAALLEWGDRYLGDDDGSPILMTHRDCGEQNCGEQDCGEQDCGEHDCGERVHVELRCEEGHRLEPRAVGLRPGPGVRPLVGVAGTGDQSLA